MSSRPPTCSWWRPCACASPTTKGRSPHRDCRCRPKAADTRGASGAMGSPRATSAGRRAPWTTSTAHAGWSPGSCHARASPSSTTRTRCCSTTAGSHRGTQAISMCTCSLSGATTSGRCAPFTGWPARHRCFPGLLSATGGAATIHTPPRSTCGCSTASPPLTFLSRWLCSTWAGTSSTSIRSTAAVGRATPGTANCSRIRRRSCGNCTSAGWRSRSTCTPPRACMRTNRPTQRSRRGWASIRPANCQSASIRQIRTSCRHISESCIIRSRTKESTSGGWTGNKVRSRVSPGSIRYGCSTTSTSSTPAVGAAARSRSPATPGSAATGIRSAFPATL